MSLGQAPTQGQVFNLGAKFCREHLSPTSVYTLLHEQSHRLFPDESFADLFAEIGRWSVPPRIVAVVMVLQRLEGLSDREAVERFSFDLRWKYAAGGLDVDYPGFVHTVLVDMRARLRRSDKPNRIFETSLEVARSAGLVGRKRVLDSTPLYDAVATQDTVTLIRSAIRGLLKVADEVVETELRKVLRRDDDYVGAGKPACDWEDEGAREALVDALARDANAAILFLDGRELSAELQAAAKLVATVVGQDLEQTEGGTFRIMRGVAPDRVISTVDPDSEIITAVEVTAGNAGDASAVMTLLAEVLPAKPVSESTESSEPPAEVFGDAAYGTGELLKQLEGQVVSNLKVQAPVAPNGIFSKEEFHVDLDGGAVTCPAGKRVLIRPRSDGGGIASFGAHCATCPMRPKCTTSKAGRNINVHPQERLLSGERKRQKDPDWKQNYKATRPKVERKLGHLMRRRHGGRRARVRGRIRVTQDFSLLAAAFNFARLAKLGAQFPVDNAA